MISTALPGRVAVELCKTIRGRRIAVVGHGEQRLQVRLVLTSFRRPGQQLRRLACLWWRVMDVYKALADPTRRTILDELTDRNGQTLFEICGRLATKHGLASSRQAISQHLDVLEAAGLVETRREGRYKFHSINTRATRTDRHAVAHHARPAPRQRH